jgi:hypothetical protein
MKGNRYNLKVLLANGNKYVSVGDILNVLSILSVKEIQTILAKLLDKNENEN